MNTPEQVAEQVARERGVPAWAMRGAKTSADSLMARAVEADREQRDIYALIAEALDERAELLAGKEHSLAADVVRSEHEQDIWDKFIGPMLDAMQKEYGE